MQKHTLSNMTRVDTNIFRDISTTPNMVPDDESLAYELRDEKDIKVMRMKSCAYTLKAVFAAQVSKALLPFLMQMKNHTL